MIKKTDHGYQVTSESGHPLSKPTLSKGEAEKRLAQVEHFKAVRDHAHSGSTAPAPKPPPADRDGDADDGDHPSPASSERGGY